MSIQHKISFGIIVLFVALSTVSADANSLIPAYPVYKSSVFTDPCNEPAPTNFQITDRTTTTITAEWDTPLIPPFQYNIKAFEVLTGNLVYNQNIGGNLTDWTIPNLQPGTEYTIRNTPVCPDGELSQYSVNTAGATAIVDLLITSFSAPNDFNSCGIGSSGFYCLADPAAGHLVTFKIVSTIGKDGESRYFGVYKASSDCEMTSIVVRPEDEASSYKFSCPGGAFAPCSDDFIQIHLNGMDQVAEITVGYDQDNIGFLAAKSIAMGYEIIRCEEQGGHFHGLGSCYAPQSDAHRPAPSKGRTAHSEQASSSALSAAPNPFSDQLDIQIPFNHPNESTKISLYDLQGRQVLHQQHPGDQQTIYLSTVNLAPGMYFLRAESGGISETIKLVKTQ